MKKIIASIITPFNEDGSINYLLFKETAATFSKMNLDAIVLATPTGEGFSLTVEEKITLLQALDDVKSEIDVFIQLYSVSTKQLIDEIDQMDHLLFSGYVITTPPLCQPGQEGVIKHFQEASRATKKQIYIYHAPTRCGSSITVKTIEQLAKIENIVGIMSETNDLELIKTVTKDLLDFDFIIADERMLSAAFNYQASGILSSLIHIIPKDIVEAINDFNDDIANPAILDFINLIADLINLDQKAVTIKYILSHTHQEGTSLRLPLLALSREKKQKIDLIID